MDNAKIELKWKPSSFISRLMDGDENSFIFEELDGELFRDAAYAKSYWSVAEKLVDLCWINDSSTGNGNFTKYLELEYGLYLVVATLGKLAGSYQENIRQLKCSTSPSAEIISFWEQYANRLRKHLTNLQDSSDSTYLVDDLIEIYRIALAAPAIERQSTKKKHRLSAARQYRLWWERIANPDQDGTPSSRPLRANDLSHSIELAADFCREAVIGFDSSAAGKLYKIAEDIMRIHKDWEPIADKGSEEYYASIWEGLQGVSDVICKMINEDSESHVTLEIMLHQVEKARELLQCNKHVKKRLAEYRLERHRCLALLETNKGLKMLAFSGFYDCQDEETREVCGSSYDENVVVAFQRISCQLDAYLAILSTHVVDRLERYNLDKSCRLASSATLRGELCKKDVNFIKKSYACCERKIVAELNAHWNVQHISAKMHVKFEPCLSCYGALTAWAQAHNVALTLEYLVV